MELYTLLDWIYIISVINVTVNVDIVADNIAISPTGGGHNIYTR